MDDHKSVEEIANEREKPVKVCSRSSSGGGGGSLRSSCTNGGEGRGVRSPKQLFGSPGGKRLTTHLPSSYSSLLPPPLARDSHRLPGDLW